MSAFPRSDDALLVDGTPRSAKPKRGLRKRPGKRSTKTAARSTPQLSAADAELREKTIRSGDVFVMKADGTTAVRTIDGKPQRSRSVRGRRKPKRKPATPRERSLTNLQPKTPAKTTTKGKHKQRSKSRKASVDQFATTAKEDRPLTPEQRSELAALARDPNMNLPGWQTLTRGEADRLIPYLRRKAKARSDAQLSKRKRRRTEVVK
jgi:hypothetical protein